MTTPFPITFLAVGLRIPDGIKCSAYLLPASSKIVCPALAPPYKFNYKILF